MSEIVAALPLSTATASKYSKNLGKLATVSPSNIDKAMTPTGWVGEVQTIVLFKI
jgi:hypothetical protein